MQTLVAGPSGVGEGGAEHRSEPLMTSRLASGRLSPTTAHPRDHRDHKPPVPPPLPGLDKATRARRLHGFLENTLSP